MNDPYVLLTVVFIIAKVFRIGPVAEWSWPLVFVALAVQLAVQIVVVPAIAGVIAGVKAARRRE